MHTGFVLSTSTMNFLSRLFTMIDREKCPLERHSLVWVRSNAACH